MSEYKLVPTEPTLEMIGAARDCADCIGDIYRAMLAAAPAVSAEPVGHAVIGKSGAYSVGALLDNDQIAYYTVKGFTVRPLYLHPPAPAVAWQPIETAPKDGTLILVSFGTNGVRAVFWDEDMGLWCVSDDKYEPRPLRGYSFNNHTAPTHWMPLPTPPNGGVE